MAQVLRDRSSATGRSMSDTQSVIWQMSTYGNSQTFQPAKRSSALAPAAEIQAVPSDLAPLTNAYTPKADITC